MTTENQKPLRNRKGKQVYAGIGALCFGLAFIVFIAKTGTAETISAYTALYVTFSTAICALCGVGIWGNVKEHESTKPTNENTTPTPINPGAGNPPVVPPDPGT